ncbi:MAG: hypothetical protein IPK72_08575 [Candidatus Eisenbacteria bacterium]|nr:hypothetical protein [Candidatus Eisenbacteria bacterium]
MIRLRPPGLIAIDPRNGDVLALASRPSFDPISSSRGSRTRSGGVSPTRITRRYSIVAIQASYPPGSTFKCLTSLAGLDAGSHRRHAPLLRLRRRLPLWQSHLRMLAARRAWLARAARCPWPAPAMSTTTRSASRSASIAWPASPRSAT